MEQEANFNRTIRVASRFSPDLVKAVDTFAKEHRLYRSHAISVLVSFALGNLQFVKENENNECNGASF